MQDRHRRFPLMRDRVDGLSAERRRMRSSYDPQGSRAARRRGECVPRENGNSASAGHSRYPSALAPHSASPGPHRYVVNIRLGRWRNKVSRYSHSRNGDRTHAVSALMGERADACRRRANDCELAASRVKDPEVRPSISTWRPVGVEWLRSKKLSTTCWGLTKSARSRMRRNWWIDRQNEVKT
jgi:hypothetical protein